MEYLAFDFGDGTVCASRYKTEWAEGQTVLEPEILHIMRGSKEVWSTLARNFETNNYEVGVNKPRRGFELQLNWKSKPSKRDEGWELRRKLTVLFMERVFELFLNSNPDYDTDGNGKWLGTYRGEPCKIAIGVPCDWSDASMVKSGAINDIDEYKKMAKEAGLGDVHVFKEAQAAVLYARRFMGDGLPDEYIEKGTLLVDIGSSTTDFTYLKGDKASNMGLTLGAKYVEQSFLGDAMRNAGYEYYAKDADFETKKTAVSVRNWNLLEVRGYKEDFFSAVDQARVAGTPAEIPTTPLYGTKLQLGSTKDEGYITEPYVDSCLDGAGGVKISLPHLSERWSEAGLNKKNTWRGHFRVALSHLREQWNIDDKEVTVIVTGGASRMQFVKDDVRSVFGENVRYRAGDSGQQSFSVVKGLAWASYATDAITDVRKEIGAEIKNILGEEESKAKIKALVDAIGDIVTDEVIKALSSIMVRHPQSVNTKRKIAKYATDKAKEILVELKSNGVLNDKIKTVTSELLAGNKIKNLFSDLQNKLGRSTIYAKLPTPSVSDVSLPDLKDMNLELDDVVNGLAIAIIYITMLCIPGVGWLLAAIMALGAAAFIENLLAKGPDDVIDNGKIRQAAGRIAGKKEEIKQKVHESLGSTQEGGYLSAVSDSIVGVITDVKMQELNALEGLANYRD